MHIDDSEQPVEVVESTEQAEQPGSGTEPAESTNQRNDQVSQTIRLLIGGYLIYIAWSLCPAAFQGQEGIIYGISMIVFAVVGVIMAFYALKALREIYSNNHLWR